MRKHRNKLLIIVLALVILVSAALPFGINQQGLTTNTAAAASVDSPSGNTGNSFTYYYVGPLTGIGICEWNGSGTNGCINGKGAEGPNFIQFDPVGQVGGGRYLFNGTNYSNGNSINITVSDTNPASGSYQLVGGPGGNPYQINVSGYDQAAFGRPAGLPGLVTQPTAPAKGSSGSLAVTSVLSATLNDVNQSAQVTYDLSQNGNVIQTTPSTTATFRQDVFAAEATVTGTFQSVPAGSYLLTSPQINGSTAVTISSPSQKAELDGGLTNAGQSSTFTNQTSPPDACNASLFSLDWLLCPFVSALTGILNWANNGIQQFLTLPVNDYFNDSCIDSTIQTRNFCTASTTDYAAWSNVRDLSLSLLVIVALIMVIATAIDIGPVDAYTVKKILPRILVVVLAVTFSWELGRALVQLSNDLGTGVGQLILSVIPVHLSLPAGQAATNADYINAIYNGGNGSLGIIEWLTGGTVLTGLGLAAVGPLALMMLLLPAVLALGLGLVVLIFRQLIVIVCIIFAPLALVAFVFPGTQRVWKLWQQSFFGAIFLYPMITGVIAIGALLAYLTMNGGVTTYTSNLRPLLALIFLIAPYFLIPRLARMSTGMLGTVANGLNNASQGLYKGLRQAQRNKMASSWQKAKKGELYHGYKWLPGSEKLAKRTGAISRGVGTGWSGHFGVGERGKQATHQVLHAAADEYMRSPQNAGAKDYDNAQYAKTFDNATEAEKGLRAKMKEEDPNGIVDDAEVKSAMDAARTSGGFGGSQAIAAARNLAASTTAYKDTVDPDTGEVKKSALEKMMDTTVRVSHGNSAVRASLAAYGSAVSKQQRPDLSPGAEASIKLAQLHEAGGAGKGGVGAGRKVFEEHLDKAFDASGSVGQMLAFAKKPAVTSFMNRQIKLMNESTNPNDRGKAALRVAEMVGNLSSAGSDQRDAIMEGLADNGFDTRQGVMQQLAAKASDTKNGTLGAGVGYNGQELDAVALANAARTFGSVQEGEASAAAAAAAAAASGEGTPGPEGGGPAAGGLPGEGQ